jgi:hypothetical protein
MIEITYQDSLVQTRQDNPDEVIVLTREDGSKLVYKPGNDDKPLVISPGGFPPPRIAP